MFMQLTFKAASSLFLVEVLVPKMVMRSSVFFSWTISLTDASGVEWAAPARGDRPEVKA